MTLILVAFIVCLCTIAANGYNSVQVTIALRQNNVRELEDMLWSISNPTSPLYARYLSLDDLKQYGTDDATILKLTEWLEKENATDIKVLPTQDYIQASVPSKLALLLFQIHKDNTVRELLSTSTSFSVLSAIDFVIATRSTSFHPVPASPHNTVTFSSTSPTFSNKLALFQHKTADENKTQGTPQNQRAAYGIPAHLVGTNPNNSQMVWGPGTYGYLASDLAKYYKEFQVNSSTSHVAPEGYVGVPGGDNFGEATLDVQVITGIAPQVNTTVCNTDNSTSAEEGDGFGPAFLQFAIGLNANSTPPLVLSLSLGSLSWDSCNILCVMAAQFSNGNVTEQECNNYMQLQRQVCMYPYSAQMDRINVELMKLGLRGVTVLAATGDGGSHFSFLRFNNSELIGKLLNEVSCEYNLPTFPSESPYVLGVGGTEWTQGGPTKPVGWLSSGGGFSWRYPVPSFQNASVQQYLNNPKNRLPPAMSFNATNRAYPDVAALALNVPIVFVGKTVSTGGTSASTPAFGGIMSLINDARLNQGLPPLGMVAPRLYQIAAQYPGEAFYDMDVGDSNCDVTGFCCKTGFPAAVGWDPTTGLGSPIWAGLYKYLSTDK